MGKNITEGTILLCGAGFSSAVGLKTLKTIVDGIQGIQVPLDDSDVPGLELVKETWKLIKADRGDRATLEDLLGRLRLYCRVADLLKSDYVFSQQLRVNIPDVMNGQFKSKWENALAFCFRLMLNNYGPQKVDRRSDGYNFLASCMKRIAEMNGNVLHVFTTNYDCLFNVMASKQMEVCFCTHINDKNGNFEADWYRANPYVKSHRRPQIFIHRLHGCVAWFRNDMSPYGVHEVYGAGDELIINEQDKLNQMAIKLVSDEAIGRMPAFSKAFEEFKEKLGIAKNLLVWGHSFRDVEVLRCIIDVYCNRRSRPFKIFYIDPYLTVNDVVQNIRTTIEDIPAISETSLAPKRIPWVLQDGYHVLLRKVDEIIT